MKKVYFAAPMRGVRGALNESRELVKLMEDNGLMVLTKHVIEDVLDTDKGMSHQEVFERDIRLLDEADILIAEVSYPSLGVGFEIAYALLKGKTVMALVKKDRVESLSSLIRGITMKNFHLIEYSSPNEAIEKILDKTARQGVS
ncbi:nucleoside 2-deoxyribosyltransferase [Infirmifilum uzonense]|uniref:nucleoside 2-deoxyribosyltransferase n=1 Tax=Infirmifilum uzonense TaxID=1550241 RepID=UPI003C723A93